VRRVSRKGLSILARKIRETNKTVKYRLGVIDRMARNSPLKRFLKKVVVNPETSCWNWTAYKDPHDGYPRFRVLNKLVRAHLWAYGHFIGPIPVDGYLSKRKAEPKIEGCTSDCVNPKHFKLKRYPKDSYKVKYRKNRDASKVNGKNLAKLKRIHDLPDGVTLNKASGRFISQVRDSRIKKMVYLGSYDSPEEAHEVFKKAEEFLNKGQQKDA